MLVISLPVGAQSGKCKINGKPCVFLIRANEFSFRPEGSNEPWDTRKILHRSPGATGLTHYACSDARPVAKA